MIPWGSNMGSPRVIPLSGATRGKKREQRFRFLAEEMQMGNSGLRQKQGRSKSLAPPCETFESFAVKKYTSRRDAEEAI